MAFPIAGMVQDAYHDNVRTRRMWMISSEADATRIGSVSADSTSTSVHSRTKERTESEASVPVLSFLQKSQALVSDLLHTAFKGLDANQRRIFLSYLAPDALIIGADTHVGAEYQGPDHLIDFALSCSLNGCVLEKGYHHVQPISMTVCLVYGSYDIAVADADEDADSAGGMYGTGAGGKILYSAVCVNRHDEVRLAHLHYTPTSHASDVSEDRFIDGFIEAGRTQDNPGTIVRDFSYKLDDGAAQDFSGTGDIIMDAIDKNMPYYAYSRMDDFMFIYDAATHRFSIDWNKLNAIYHIPPPPEKDLNPRRSELLAYLSQFVSRSDFGRLASLVNWRAEEDSHAAGKMKELQEMLLTGSDGTEAWVSVAIIPLSNRMGNVSKTLVHVRNIDKLKRKENELFLQVRQDTLTGLLNRKGLQEGIESSLEAEAASPGVFLMLDIDSFKQLNDRFGHVFGDQFLSRFGQELARIVDTQAIVGRMGGDEFVIYYSHRLSREEIEKLFTSISYSLALIRPADPSFPSVSCSIGVAYARPGDTFSDLYRNADKALYVRKRSGKSGFSLFQD